MIHGSSLDTVRIAQVSEIPQVQNDFYLAWARREAGLYIAYIDPDGRAWDAGKRVARVPVAPESARGGIRKEEDRMVTVVAASLRIARAYPCVCIACLRWFLDEGIDEAGLFAKYFLSRSDRADSIEIYELFLRFVNDWNPSWLRSCCVRLRSRYFRRLAVPDPGSSCPSGNATIVGLCEAQRNNLCRIAKEPCQFLVEYTASDEEKRYAAAEELALLERFVSLKDGDQILRQELEENEPSVWLLWVRDGSPANLLEWWSGKQKLPSLSALLAEALQDYKSGSRGTATREEVAQLRENMEQRLGATECARWGLLKLKVEEIGNIQRLGSVFTRLQIQSLDEIALRALETELDAWEPFMARIRAAQAGYERLMTMVSGLACNVVLTQEKHQFQLLPTEDQARLQNISRELTRLQSHSCVERGLMKVTSELEGWQASHEAISAKMVALQEMQERLITLKMALKQQLESIQEQIQLLMLSEEEQEQLQKYVEELVSLQPQSLDATKAQQTLDKLESWQPYLNMLSAKIVTLIEERETRKRIEGLIGVWQTLFDATFKILGPIEERNEIQLLPVEEQSVLLEFIGYLRSLVPTSLTEVDLKKEIVFIESKQTYVASVQKKTVVLAQQRVEKVAVIEEKIRKLHLKAEAAKLAKDYKKVIEVYVSIVDSYRNIVALGLDCSRQLAEIDCRIKEAQSQLSQSSSQLHTPPSPMGSSVMVPSPDQLRCRVLPYAELQLEQELGSGAFGTVYRGLWRTENIAVKKLHSVQLTASSRQAFISEVEIMTKLDSERLVRLYGTCVAPDPYCIVMEYMPRGSLYGLLHGTEQYSWQVSLQIAVDIGNALAFLHREKIIHRDLKSLNILLDSQYRAKICDFGLSKVRQEVSVTSTRPGTSVGTNAWNAPELFGLRPKYSFASDIYAYGIILWEILTRETPYKDVLDPNEIKSAVKAGEREEIPATCSVKYRSAIENCWAQVPEQRPQALQVVQALQSEFAVTSVKSWHIAPELKPTGRNLEGFHLISAGDYDMQKVVACYQRCPVPGMEIGRVTIIFNSVLNQSFVDGIELLEGRCGNPAFAATWSSDGDATITAWRGEVNRRFEAMAHPYQDPACQHVKILPVWHGTKKALIESIAKAGYANLGTTDPGFFGKGVYSSYEAEYAHRVYGPGQYRDDGILLVNWIACFSAYPVVGYQVPGYTGMVPDATDCPGDMVQLMRGGNFGNYDAHFIPVRPSKINPETSYYPCRPNERATYHEVVVFEKAQILPRYIVELQPTLVAAPAVAPLLAATGIFGRNPERPEEAAASAPTP